LCDLAVVIVGKSYRENLKRKGTVVPHHKSAKKRVRGSENKRIQNKKRMSSVKTLVKNFRNAVDGIADKTVESETVKSMLSQVQSGLSRAVSRGLLHPNNASRRISRLARFFKTTTKTLAQVPEGHETSPQKTAKKTTVKKGAATKKKSRKKTTKKKSSKKR